MTDSESGRRPDEAEPERWEPCDRGICAANKGHKGTCAEASGWADDDWVAD